MSRSFTTEVDGRMLVLAVAGIDSVVADATVRELVPRCLLEAKPYEPPTPLVPVDIWRQPAPNGPPIRPKSWLAPADDVPLPVGMVDLQRSKVGHQRWLLQVRVVDDVGVLIPEALTTSVENIFAVATGLKAKRLVMPGLGLAARYVVPRQVAWLTVPEVLRRLALSPVVSRFGILLDNEDLLAVYVDVLKSVFRKGEWTY